MADENRDALQVEIGDLIGFVDLNGVEAMQTEQVQRLEELISQCNELYHSGDALVADSVWDRLMEILSKVNPESELCKYIWEDSVDEVQDDDSIFMKNPMFSIQTVKSFECDELAAFIERLPDEPFDAHVSAKLNGHGIRLKFVNGDFVNARSRARASAGRDITAQLRVLLDKYGLTHIDEFESFPLCEVRGEWVLPFANLDEARSYNSEIKSAFTAVASMGRDSASEEEWALLDFVAYEFLADGVSFSSKEEEYEYLEGVGFEVPICWVINDLEKDSLVESLKGIVSDCEEEMKPDSNGNGGYTYYTDGLVFSLNDVSQFRSIGDDGGHYKYGNIALKVGYWKQDMYAGYVQTILWMKGRTKLTPVALVADEPDIAKYSSGLSDVPYIMSKSEVTNYDKLGVVTAGGNRVRRVPLYEPNNIVVLDAYPGGVLHFRYGGEAGVVPCFEDGTALVDGRIKQMLEDDYIEVD